MAKEKQSEEVLAKEAPAPKNKARTVKNKSQKERRT